MLIDQTSQLGILRDELQNLGPAKFNLVTSHALKLHLVMARLNPGDSVVSVV
jgi:hypothetical protein